METATKRKVTQSAAAASSSFSLLTLELVQAATISCIAHGVTITMYPKDIAAIVRDADPFNLRSNETT